MSKVVQSNTQVRQVAIQVLYQLLNPDTEPNIDDAIAYALSSGLYPEDGYDNMSPKAKELLLFLVQGVIRNLDEIDQTIEKYLTNWTVDRIATIDAMILRLATFELTDSTASEQVPGKVAVDEGIELAKFYSNDTSRRFVTGVLGNMLKDVDETTNE